MNADIRPGVEDDLPKLTEIYNYYVEHTPATFDCDPFTIDGRRAWFAKYRAAGPYRLLVAVANDVVVGYATSSPFRAMPAYSTTVETSVYLATTHGGHGIGSLLYTALFESIRGEDLHRAYAAMTVPNPASLALHHKFGFRTVGFFSEAGRKMGEYRNVEWLEKELPHTPA